MSPAEAQHCLAIHLNGMEEAALSPRFPYDDAEDGIDLHISLSDIILVGLAAECMRKKLAPLALNAYPEAYAEFRRALLLLVYSQHEDVSPVASEWSAHSRADLAAVLSRTLRQASGMCSPLHT